MRPEPARQVWKTSRGVTRLSSSPPPRPSPTPRWCPAQPDPIGPGVSASFGARPLSLAKSANRLFVSGRNLFSNERGKRLDESVTSRSQLPLHPCPAAFHELLDFALVGHRSVPGRGHRQSAVGGAVLHGLLGVAGRHQAVDEA